MNVVVNLCIWPAFLFLIAKSQFPRKCINNDCLKKKECCPVPPGFMAPCGSDAERGECEQITGLHPTIIYQHYDETRDLDDRHKWPFRFFKRACRCKANFAGYDCSKCEFGHYGERCRQRKTVIRRNFTMLLEEEKVKYMRYINMSRFTYSEDYVVARTFHQDLKKRVRVGVDLTELFVNVSVYDLFVWRHYYAAGIPERNQVDFGHNGQGFPTFHRYLILAWERALQEVSGDEDFAIPFWDWRGLSECDICSLDLLGRQRSSVDGSIGGTYLDNWYTICLEEQLNEAQMSSGARICDPRIHKPRITRLSKQERTFSEKQGFPVNFPTKKEVDFTLRFELYDAPPYNVFANCSFRNLLEGFANTKTGYSNVGEVNMYGRGYYNMRYMHNRVHKVLGGCMADTAIAPNDPIFLLHHSFVDWILEKWLRKYKKTASVLTGTQAPIGQNRDSVIVPFFPIRTHGQMFQQSYELGYDFDGMDENGLSPDDEDDDSTSGDLGCCQCHDPARPVCEGLKDYYRLCSTRHSEENANNH